MKVLRIDNQRVLEGRVYKTLEDLRLQLCDYHSIDWQIGIDKDDKDYTDIYSLTLEDIMDQVMGGGLTLEKKKGGKVGSPRGIGKALRGWGKVI